MKVFVVGFPKSGTTTLTEAFRRSGVRAAHYQTPDKQFCGALLYKGFFECGDPWRYLQDYDAITQADVCRSGPRRNCWPQLDFAIVNAIERRYPECRFLLNTRDSSAFVRSVDGWGSLRRRFSSLDVPGLPRGWGKDDKDLERWTQGHYAACREYFRGKTNFFEFDIGDPQAPQKIGMFLGLEIKWWGVANQKSFKPGVLPSL